MKLNDYEEPDTYENGSVSWSARIERLREEEENWREKKEWEDFECAECGMRGEAATLYHTQCTIGVRNEDFSESEEDDDEEDDDEEESD